MTAPVAVRRLFVANRGEIALRIAATCRRLGIEPTIPGLAGVPPVDLLDAGAIVELARRVGADTVHPGYGFLSETPELASAVLDAGLRWVGPPPRALALTGDKAAARRLAASIDVPIVPGYDGDDQSDDRLAAEAGRIGYPILVKPAGGGGGKGMRVVRSADRLPDALAGARREARAAFGDDRLILEAFVEASRHVEIQVLFDGRGHGVHLGERDCSTQRRHQKVLEEAPSPGIDDALRRRLGEAALRLGEAVGYAGAGTCEFLVDDHGSFFFLEVNARLQVEHPVTEAVTGRDLVADQLAIATGAELESIGLDERSADRARQDGGHAVEARLYAEDAEDGFLPSTGRIVDLRWPVGAAAFDWTADVRVDAGIERGTAVSERFDPMLAKILARAPTRAAALDRLATALDETIVLGVVTNLRFLRWLVRSPAVRAGEARTDTLERTWPPDGWRERAAIPDEAWSAAANALLGDDRAVDAGAGGAWSGGWRVNAPPRIRLAADGAERTVVLGDPRPRAPLRSAVAGDGETVWVDVAGRSVALSPAPAPDVDRAATAAAGDQGQGEAIVAAPMPGVVITAHVASGVAVQAGDPIVTLEAMKMEHVVAAPLGGRVLELAVAAGDQVVRGAPLARIAADGTDAGTREASAAGGG